jgi:hypothetical protein
MGAFYRNEQPLVIQVGHDDPGLVWDWIGHLHEHDAIVSRIGTSVLRGTVEAHSVTVSTSKIEWASHYFLPHASFHRSWSRLPGEARSRLPLPELRSSN